MAGAKTKSGREVRFLFSKGTPLTGGQKEKLHRELSSGAVRVKGGKKQIGRQKRLHVRVRRK